MLTAEQKLQLIRDIHNVCYPNVASYHHDNVGIDLSYISQAILYDAKCEMSPFSFLIQLLQAEFEPLHILWKFVFVEPTVTCINCEYEILWCNASFCMALNGWLGHRCCAQDDDNYYEEISYETI